MNLLSVDNLSIGHNFSIVKDLNFNVDAGQVFVIKGCNGAGKSTLVKTLVGEVDKVSGNYKWNISLDKVMRNSINRL